MRVIINGEEAFLPDSEGRGFSVKVCLEARGLDPAVVVVERNRTIVPADTFAATMLEEGDVLEILHFVGGG